MLLAALPATPVQLAHACYELGFEIVVPASWGDELVAHAVLEDLRHRDREPVIQCTCPLVSERLLANGQHLLPSMVQTASPPVAAARYARHAFSPRNLNITYIGACPGARHPSIDERCVPDELLRALAERDISLADMPTVFDSVLPPDRRRFSSLPGGCPTQEALWQASDGRMLREVTQPTFSTDLAQTLVWREHVMVDVAPSLGCACAGSCSRLGARQGRVAVMAVEPPRATQPVVNYKGEFAAPTGPPLLPAETTNGDTPPVRITNQRDEEEPAAATSNRPADQGPITAPATRSRVRTTTPLPRAYLAKRRHLAQASAPAVAESEAPPVTRPVKPAVETPFQSVQPEPVAVEQQEAPRPPIALEPVAVAPAELLQADIPPEPTAAAQQELPPAVVDPELVTSPNEITVSAPNESAPEPVDEVSRPIAVHIEPEPARPEEVVAQEATPDAGVRQGTTPDVQGHLFMEEAPAPESVATATLTEEEEWAPPTSVPRVAEELVEESLPLVERSGPLRVEVEIFEEVELATREEVEPTSHEEVVVPDAIHDAERKEFAAPEIIVRPRSPWADFLIALWLLLVTSAVIAALLWRR